MSESLKAAVRAAVLRLLDPLVKWLLEAGVGVGDLMSLVKIAYVRAAREQGHSDGGEQQRPNASRIAVLTGLTRAEVTSLLAAGDAERPYDRGRQRAERVLTGWWNDPLFQDTSGQPALLTLRGRRRSFAALVGRYSGESPRVATILNELLRVKAVRKHPDGRLEAVSRTYATVRWNPDGVAAFGEQLTEHCATLLHNLRFPARARYLRRVVNARIDPRYVPMLTRDLEEQAESFADGADDALNHPGYTVTGKDGDATSLGVALYVFEAASGNAEADESSRPDHSAVGPKAKARRRPRRSAG